MMEYKSVELSLGRNLKSDLDHTIEKMTSAGWRYIGSIQNEAMGTVLVVFERGE